jgi:hypothetical protein
MTTTAGADTAGVRQWTRRLALCVVLVTCLGGAAYVLVSRPHGDCAVVGDMMTVYSEFQVKTAPRARSASGDDEDAAAVADAEAETAQRLHLLATDIELPPLRRAALGFADAVARSAQTQRDDAERPAELDPFQAILPVIDPGEMAADDAYFSSAHILLTACPSAPRPYGLS